MIQQPSPEGVQTFSRLSVSLVRDPEVRFDDLPKLYRPAEVVHFLWHRIFSTLDREALCGLYLATDCRVIGWSLIHLGRIDRCFADSRLILLPAILSSATQIIIAHNHPSGQLSISPEDRNTSHKLAAACSLLDIQLVDSLVLCEPNRPDCSARWARIDWPGKEIPREIDWLKYGTNAGILDASGSWAP